MDSVKTFNVEKVRVKMEVFGTLFGKEVYSVQSSNLDPKYNAKKNEGALVPIKPIKVYIVKRHNIVGVNANVDAANNPVVILTDQTGEEIRCSINKPDFKEVSVASVKEAIESFENKSGTVFFADCGKLTREVNELNKSSRAAANELAKEMAAQANALSEAIEKMNEESRRYYESLNL